MARPVLLSLLLPVTTICSHTSWCTVRLTGDWALEWAGGQAWDGSEYMRDMKDLSGRRASLWVRVHWLVKSQSGRAAVNSAWWEAVARAGTGACLGVWGRVWERRALWVGQMLLLLSGVHLIGVHRLCGGLLGLAAVPRTVDRARKFARLLARERIGRDHFGLWVGDVRPKCRMYILLPRCELAEATANVWARGGTHLQKTTTTTH